MGELRSKDVTQQPGLAIGLALLVPQELARLPPAVQRMLTSVDPDIANSPSKQENELARQTMMRCGGAACAYS
eukprot:711136-Pelagomonas_calceolata.AAC.9